MYDFLSKISCARVLQLLPTSPFLQQKDFLSFSDKSFELISSKNALISVGAHRIACVHEDGTPINFERLKKNPPSQEMGAVLSYATVLMSWNSKEFKLSFENSGYAYHGNNLNIYHPLSLLSLMDIDTEEDYEEAERIGSMLK
jgi:hypothetical protein